ncbi:hypothetical protein PAMC26577_16640 [Caballeronia sordidicola]|uniref:Uncharacterized protein n=1 Tax=Caballeronia sordidicola TaxID=196367 RepID=A0A242MS03_CABSO|nr:hypothetical protein PAMC26577_16640 [Caballeronia sordidicola]
MRRYQRHQFGPRNHTVHLVEELSLTRSFGRQIQSQISLFHSTIVAAVDLFGNPILHDLCRPSLTLRNHRMSLPQCLPLISRVF